MKAIKMKPVKSHVVKAKPVDCMYGCGRKDMSGRGICRECWRKEHRRALKSKTRKAPDKRIKQARKHG